MPLFDRYVGVDYSGAQTPFSSLSSLRVYEAKKDEPPREVMPPVSPRKYWTRHGIAEWVAEQIAGAVPLLIGIDHGFSFPKAYFESHGLPKEWVAFLDDFQHHWPTDQEIYVDFVRDGLVGDGAARRGKATWLRLTERWTPAAKSVFLFDVQGSVAKSTHAGLPWLRYLRERCSERVHFWPFDGWGIPTGRSVIAEVYPSLWMRRFPVEKRNGDQHAAYAAAAWLQGADRSDALPRYFNPPLTREERKVAAYEGWILGVV